MPFFLFFFLGAIIGVCVPFATVFLGGEMSPSRRNVARLIIRALVRLFPRAHLEVSGSKIDYVIGNTPTGLISPLRYSVGDGGMRRGYGSLVLVAGIHARSEDDTPFLS